MSWAEDFVKYYIYLLVKQYYLFVVCMLRLAILASHILQDITKQWNTKTKHQNNMHDPPIHWILTDKGWVWD